MKSEPINRRSRVKSDTFWKIERFRRRLKEKFTGKDHASDNVVSWKKGDILECVAYESPIKNVSPFDKLIVIANPGIHTDCYNLSTGKYVSAMYHLWTDDLFRLLSRLDSPPDDDYMLDP